MAIKDILLYLDNDNDCENRIKSTTKLGKQLGAHIVGLYITRSLRIHPYPYTYFPAAIYESVAVSAEQQRQEVETLFNDLCAAEGVSAEFRSIDNQLSNALRTQCRYADLLIVPKRDTEDSHLNLDYQLDEILPVSACPVLVLPENSDSMAQLPKRVMLAWNGSHESARALSSALPMLEQVEIVDIVSVSEDETEAADIARHLARHDITVNVHLVEGSSFNAGSTLLNQATTLESDMIIMGAYGHSRFRELVLGGATKYMLDHATLPILFSH